MGKFVIKESEAGFHFNLVAANGQIIGRSEKYKSEASCRDGIDSVRRCSAGGVEDQTVEGFETVKHPKFEVYEDKGGKFRFRLKARNGEIILPSQAYKDKASCLKGIESVKANAPDAEVVKE
jgi:uncharacterized protein YegP (UPF0339 family)